MQLKTLNGRQFSFSIKIKIIQTKLNIKCFYISNDSATCVSSEIQFVVYARHSVVQYFHFTLGVGNFLSSPTAGQTIQKTKWPAFHSFFFNNKTLTN